ncbi:putative RNA-directed DNA polymerase, eukaryota, reverse transcriptase zinc-binding domain protein [Tanacetum coccineum]
MSSILVNGSPTKEFAMERSIRQGDPLSPFLFLIVAESLNVAMQEAVRGGLFDGVKVGLDDIEVSHLQYADDTIFVGDWNRRNIIIGKDLDKIGIRLSSSFEWEPGSDVVNDAVLAKKGYCHEDEWDFRLKEILRTSASGG